MFRLKRVIVLVAVLLLVGGGLSPSAMAEEKTLKIGALGPFSGSGATWGGYLHNPTKMWADDVNAAGGITVGGVTYKFDVVTGDDKWTPSEALTQTRRMVNEEKVQFMVGPVTGGTSMAIQQFCEDNKIVYFSEAVSPNLVPQFKYTFTAYIGERDIPHLFLVAKNYSPERKTIYSICPDTSSGHWYYEAAVRVAKNMGYQMLGGDFYAYGASDFYPLLTKAKESKAQIIFLYAFEGEGVTVLQQARELKMDVIYLTPLPVGIPLMVKNSSWETLNGMTSITYDGTGPAWEAFSKRYNDKWGVPPELATCLYSACEAYGQAMKNANSADKEKVMQALRAPDFKFVTKPYGKEIRFHGQELLGYNTQLGTVVDITGVRDAKLAKFPKATEEEAMAITLKAWGK
jgi:branched-chain amino acid transport system substrate-binding protein